MSLSRPLSERDLEALRVSVWEAPSMGEPGSDRAGEREGGSPGTDAQEDWLPTAERLEELRQAAREDGYAEGLRQGREAAEAEAARQQKRQQAREGERCKRLDEMLDSLARPLEDVDQEVLDQLVELALVAARHVVGRELRTEPGEVMAVIREALPLLPPATREVRVHVSPEDYRLLQERGAEAGDYGERAWRLVEDRGVATGGCLVRSDVSLIDATVERRINALFHQVFGSGRRAGDGSGEPHEPGQSGESDGSVPSESRRAVGDRR